MTNSAPVNVVSMTGYQKSRRPLSQSEAANVLDDCRDLALARLVQTVSSMLDKMDDDLGALAEKAQNLDEQNAFLNARREARLKRTAMEAAFKKHFVALFGEKTARKTEPAPATDNRDALSLELSLVGDEEIEEAIAVSNMATALQDSCEGELQAIAARMGFLLESPDLELKATPISPEMIHNAFKAACKQLVSSFNVQLAVMKLFDRYLSRDLLAIYQEINGRLKSRQILPDIRPGYRGKPKPGGSARQTAAASASAAADAAAQNSQEVFALLQQLLMKSSQQLGQPIGGLAGSGPAAISGADLAATLTNHFFDSLNRLQHGEAGAVSSLGTAIDAQMFAAGSTNLLHEIRGSPFAAGIGQFDAITIDIVAMLFDYIFEDPKIPDAMKALIGRLQIPVLKVAMLDKKFFSSKSHPTRKLLDSIASAAIGRGNDLSQSDPLYKETERIVQRVLLEFESDVSIFEELLAELDAFLASEEKQQEQTVERSARIIHDRERLEIARVIADDEIRRRVENLSMVTMVRDFLRGAWAHVLTHAHAADGEDGAPWKDALRTMDELLWSVKPKMTAEARKQLVTVLPGLLKRLHSGMAGVAMDEEEQRQFFANLVTCHTRSIKAGLGADAGQQSDDNPALSWTTAGHGETASAELPAANLLDAMNEAGAEAILVRTNVAEGDVQIEEVTLANEGDVSSFGDQQWAEVTASLKRGTWVDFRQDDGGFLRYKLSWVSPLKKVYLFTNISSQKALSISPQAMEMQLREGAAVILQNMPLMDRAVENMLETLQLQS